MILVLNTGSSSVKAAVFDATLSEVTRAAVTGLGGDAAVLERAGQTEGLGPVDHAQAIRALLGALGDQVITAVAHRVVHGGTALTAPCQITPQVIQAIEAMVPLAPLHNPPALAGIRAVQAARPDLPQYASFDTAFHASQPDLHTTYALPPEVRAQGIRRYGFHGLSYASLVTSMGAALPARLLAFHLGNGASLCAIHQGRSVASSMGYSPLEGLTMGTRSGCVDAMAVLRLAQEQGITKTAALLNTASGLKGLAGIGDMRALHAAGTAQASFAIDHFCYWAARHAGSAVVAMGGLDAIAFTGGIGENDAQVRAKITAHLALFGPVPVHIIAAQEERQIAQDALRLRKEAA